MVAVTFVAMIGVGVAEKAGMMGALIRKLVSVAPAALIAFFIIFVGVLSSVASDAGYLILIPLGGGGVRQPRPAPAGRAGRRLRRGRLHLRRQHPDHPVDSMLTEMTNEAIGIVRRRADLTVTANWYFSIASSILMAIVAVIVTQRIVEPRLGKWDPDRDGEVADAPGARGRRRGRDRCRGQGPALRDVGAARP